MLIKLEILKLRPVGSAKFTIDTVEHEFDQLFPRSFLADLFLKYF